MSKKEYERIRKTLLSQRRKVNGKEWGRHATFWSDLPGQDWQKSLTSAPSALLVHFGNMSIWRIMSAAAGEEDYEYKFNKSIALAGPGDKLP